jgi:hypothetical protein
MYLQWSERPGGTLFAVTGRAGGADVAWKVCSALADWLDVIERGSLLATYPAAVAENLKALTYRLRWHRDSGGRPQPSLPGAYICPVCHGVKPLSRPAKLAPCLGVLALPLCPGGCHLFRVGFNPLLLGRSAAFRVPASPAAVVLPVVLGLALRATRRKIPGFHVSFVGPFCAAVAAGQLELEQRPSSIKLRIAAGSRRAARYRRIRFHDSDDPFLWLNLGCGGCQR